MRFYFGGLLAAEGRFGLIYFLHRFEIISNVDRSVFFDPPSLNWLHCDLGFSYAAPIATIVLICWQGRVVFRTQQVLAVIQFWPVVLCRIAVHHALQRDSQLFHFHLGRNAIPWDCLLILEG